MVIKYFTVIVCIILTGCGLYAGKPEVFNWEQRENMPAGNYLMNCAWEEVSWETNWGHMYLNCEQYKE